MLNSVSRTGCYYKTLIWNLPIGNLDQIYRGNQTPKWADFSNTLGSKNSRRMSIHIVNQLFGRQNFPTNIINVIVKKLDV